MLPPVISPHGSHQYQTPSYENCLCVVHAAFISSNRLSSCQSRRSKRYLLVSNIHRPAISWSIRKIIFIYYHRSLSDDLSSQPSSVSASFKPSIYSSIAFWVFSRHIIFFGREGCCRFSRWSSPIPLLIQAPSVVLAIPI